jgi:hypothetical protein
MVNPLFRKEIAGSVLKPNSNKIHGKSNKKSENYEMRWTCRNTHFLLWIVDNTHRHFCLIAMWCVNLESRWCFCSLLGNVGIHPPSKSISFSCFNAKGFNIRSQEDLLIYSTRNHINVRELQWLFLHCCASNQTSGNVIFLLNRFSDWFHSIPIQHDFASKASSTHQSCARSWW